MQATRILFYWVTIIGNNKDDDLMKMKVVRKLVKRSISVVATDCSTL